MQPDALPHGLAKLRKKRRDLRFDGNLSASIERILALPLERVIIAHGEIITTNARDTVRGGLAWL